MALDTLKGIKEVGGEKIIVMDELREQYPEKFNESGAMDWQWFEKDIRPNAFIYVRNDKNSVSFTIQNGPIKEVGKNGCQVDHLMYVALEMLSGLNRKFPCVENERAISSLADSLKHLADRKANREKRGVEGTSQK